MKRRTAVKGLILFSLGTGMIYSCTDKYKAIRDLNLDHFTPENNELDLLANLSNLIVPLNTIEALKNHTPLPYIFTMLDDVYEAKDRDVFVNGYKNFDVYAETSQGKKFTKMKVEEQKSFLAQLNNPEVESDVDIQNFFDILKRESIAYLRTSELYQRKINYYEMAPGRFKGSVLIDDLKNANEV